MNDSHSDYLQELREKISSYKQKATEKQSEFVENETQRLSWLEGDLDELGNNIINSVFYGFENDEFDKCRKTACRKVRSLIRFYQILGSAFPSECVEVQEHFLSMEESDEGGHGHFVENLEQDLEDDQDLLLNDIIPMSIVVNLLAVIENFLDGTVKCAAAIAEPKDNLKKGKYDNINYHIQRLKKLYGIPIKLDKNTNKSLDSMREFRNQFLHELGRDLPEQIEQMLNEWYGATNLAECNEEFVFKSFHTTWEILLKVSEVYISWKEKKC